MIEVELLLPGRLAQADEEALTRAVQLLEADTLATQVYARARQSRRRLAPPAAADGRGSSRPARGRGRAEDGAQGFAEDAESQTTPARPPPIAGTRRPRRRAGRSAAPSDRGARLRIAGPDDDPDALDRGYRALGRRILVRPGDRTRLSGGVRARQGEQDAEEGGVESGYLASRALLAQSVSESARFLVASGAAGAHRSDDGQARVADRGEVSASPSARKRSRRARRCSAPSAARRSTPPSPTISSR